MLLPSAVRMALIGATSSSINVSGSADVAFLLPSAEFFHAAILGPIWIFIMVMPEARSSWASATGSDQERSPSVLCGTPLRDNDP